MFQSNNAGTSPTPLGQIQTNIPMGASSSSRGSTIQIRTLTKSEYIASKNIPNANPVKKSLAEANSKTESVYATPLPYSIEKRIVEVIELERRQARSNEEALLQKIQYLEGEVIKEREQSRATRERIKLEYEALVSDEKEKMIQAYEKQFTKVKEEMNVLVTIKGDYEKRMRVLDEEKRSSEDEVTKLKKMRGDYEREIDELRRGNSERDRYAAMVNDYKKAKEGADAHVAGLEAQIRALEEDISEREDAKNRLMSGYEAQVSSLAKDLSAQKLVAQGELTKLLQQLSSSREENQILASEVGGLRATKKALETQLEQLSSERSESADAAARRAVELEDQLRSLADLFDKERRLTLEKENRCKALTDEVAALSMEKVNLIRNHTVVEHQFQVDIENLRNELETAKKSALELEYVKRCSSTLTEQVNTLQGQITMHSTRCKELEADNRKLAMVESEYVAELNMLKSQNDSLRRLEGDVSEWKTKAVKAAGELEHSREDIERLSLKIEDLERQNIELTNVVERQNTAIRARSAEIEGLKVAADKEKKEIVERWTEERATTEDGVRKLREKHVESENIIALLKSEVESLQGTLVNRSQELDGACQRWRHAEAEKVRVTEELTTATGRWKQEKSALELSTQGQREKIDEVENNLALVITENERLKGVAHERSKEIDQWKAKCSAVERNAILQSEEVRSEGEAKLRNAERDFKAVLARGAEEKAGLENALARENQIVKELEQRVNHLVSENEKLSAVLSDRVTELDGLKIRVAEVINQKEREVLALKEESERDKRRTLEQVVAEFEGKAANERANYDEIVEKLKKKLVERETHMNVIALERDNFKETVMKKEAELTIAIGRYEQAERAHAKELEGILSTQELERQTWEKTRGELQFQLHSVRETNEEAIRRYKQRIHDLELAALNLNGEIDKLATNVNERGQEIELWKTRFGNLEKRTASEADDLRAQLVFADEEKRRLNSKIEDVEVKLTKATVEFETALQHVAEKSGEIEVWKGRYVSLEKKFQADFEEARVQADVVRRVAVEKEREDITAKFAAERSNYEHELKKNKQKLIDFENRITYLQNEAERLAKSSAEKDVEIEMLRNRYQALETEHNNSVEELTLQLEACKKNAALDLEREISIKFGAERTSLETQIVQFKQKIGELDNRLTSALHENERLSKVNFEKTEELNRLKNQNAMLESGKLYDFEDLRTQLEGLKRSNMELKENALHMNSEKSQLESMLRQVTSSYENSRSELEKVYELLNARKKDLEVVQKESEDLRKESLKIRNEKALVENELAKKSDRLSAQSAEIDHLASVRDNYKNQLEKNGLELTRKNKELIDKIQELDILKAKYEEGIRNVEDHVENQLEEVQLVEQLCV